MRIKIVALSVAMLSVVLPHAAEARARGGGGGGFAMSASVGYAGGAVIGAYASPYYQGPYGYAPAYYHNSAAYYYQPNGYGYGGNSGYYYGPSAYSYAAAPCWYRPQAVYGTYGDVVGVTYESICR